MERKQFTFYQSFYAAISKIKKKSDRCDAYDAIVLYALYGTEIDKLPDVVEIALSVIRPVLDSSRRKAEAGSIGGASKPQANASKPQANASKPQANRKQGQEQGQEQVQEQVQDKEQLVLSIQQEVEAMRESGIPTEGAEREIRDAVAKYGEEQVLEAIRIGRDNGARSWAYVRKVLDNPPARSQVDRNNAQYVHHGQSPSPMMIEAMRRLEQEEKDNA